MNDRAKERKPNYRQRVVIGFVILAAIYHFSRPTLEKWFNTSLPSITQDGDQQANNAGTDFKYDVSLPESNPNKNDLKQGSGSRDSQVKNTPANNNLSPGQAARNWLKEIGRKQYKSPAGLVYGSGQEHRIEHVLLHCKDDISKPTHGVFVGDAVEVMQLIDEAYELAKSGSSKSDSEKSGDKMTHTVSMGRVIGHTGGKKAKRNGRKELKRIKLVLADNRVITAFPTN